MSEDAQELWSGLGLIGPLEARLSGPLPARVGGVSIDTRTLAPGDLFVAIRGDTHDGHDYVKAAFDKGAAAAVIEERRADDLRGAGPLYVVRDALRALEGLGMAARARSAARIVAVTGSVGKTSTKETLRTVFAAFGPTHASVASYNNHWGVPLTLARLPRAAEFGVFEIGMNHPGEITPLVAMVKPHLAVVTAIAPVHLEHMGSLEAIVDAKAEIFSGVARGGAAVIPRDAPLFERLAEAAARSPIGHVVSFGEHEQADARLESCTPDGEGSLIHARILGQPIVYRLGAPGRHMAVNSLAVLVAARATGCPLSEAAAALAQAKPAKGRGARETLTVEGAPATLIDEAYNANPASMRAALALLGDTTPGAGGRRIAAIGDMLELGPDGAQMHAELAEALEAAQVDLLFAAGPLSRHLFDAAPEEMRAQWAASAAELEAPLAAALRGGDVVMIKGSNGSRMGPIVAALQRRFGAAAQGEG
ncbi:MAG: UDP-N-acetylmuramoylalanyl-D-glutamyl-2,6-diaminopimelate--D-alanyl-D-alanine ligase [Methylobacteriaceae bacterium]|nr:UDP-N-acetylmuramoylalanyl-D-glutamyl-2,6-diaminopimelate--D-alanyl-D-alanine ligase [Methylobacteriaceae bacterium]